MIAKVIRLKVYDMKHTDCILACIVLLVAFAPTSLDAQGPENAATQTETEVLPGKSRDDQEGRSLTKDHAKEVVQRKIEQFHKGIRSNVRKERQDALESMAPTEEQLMQLFGQTNGRKCYTALRPRLKKMLESIDEVSNQFSRDGEVVSVELHELDIPERVEAQAFKVLFANVPDRALRFDAKIRTSKTVSHSESYFVIDEDVVCLSRGQLIEMARSLNR